MDKLMEQPDLAELTGVLTYREKRGLAKGRQQGLVEGKRDSLLKQMRRRFGELPEGVVARIESISNADELDDLSFRILDARSLEEMGIGTE
jgi:hypothetical protein